MKRTVALILVCLTILAALAACSSDVSSDPTGEKTNAGVTDRATGGDADGDGDKEEQPQAKKRKSNIRFYDEQQAQPLMDHGLAEVQGYLAADKNAEYTERILARYYNNYLLPYTEMLAEKQVLFEPGSVASNWWPEGTASMKENLNSTLANAYRKLAQDMLPYMLPDPDELLVNLALKFGGDPNVDKKLDISAMKQAYETYLDNWDFVHHSLLTTDWGTFWEDNLYYGEGYPLNGVYVSFTSPKYNRQMLVNVEVYGADDEEHREAFLPLSTASNLLTEIQEARSHGSEFYIQNISIGTSASSEAEAANKMWEVFKICFPHANEDELRVRFDEVLNGETKHMFVRSHDFIFRFNRYMNFLNDPDYSFVMPQADLYDGAQTRFEGAGYLVDINDWYTNGTCDSYMKIGINKTGYNSDSGTYSCALSIEIGGNECLPTNLYRDGDIFYAVNYQVQYGVYYPIYTPFYFSEAVNSGYFTPYVILDPQPEGEGDIPLIPEYPAAKKEKTLRDTVGDGTQEPVREKQETKWLREGFGDDFKFPERRKELPDADLSALGYHHNEDGTWTRDMMHGDFVKSYSLIYDEKGVLTGGIKTFTDGTMLTVDYATDINFNPVMSIDRYYDAEGKQTDVAIARYNSSDSRAYERTFYESEVRPGEIDNFKKQSIHYDETGDVCDRTIYKDNQPATRWYVNTIENTVGTQGDMRTEYVKTVTTDTYAPDGSIAESKTETVITTEEKAEAGNAVQKYLEEVTGVKRDY